MQTQGFFFVQLFTVLWQHLSKRLKDRIDKVKFISRSTGSFWSCWGPALGIIIIILKERQVFGNINFQKAYIVILAIVSGFCLAFIFNAFASYVFWAGPALFLVAILHNFATFVWFVLFLRFLLGFLFGFFGFLRFGCVIIVVVRYLKSIIAKISSWIIDRMIAYVSRAFCFAV